jgi:hypothetical protein
MPAILSQEYKSLVLSPAKSVMLYIFTKTGDCINDNLIVNSETQLTFVYQTVALSEKADVKIVPEGPLKESFVTFGEKINNQKMAAVYDEAGVQSDFYDNLIHLSKKPVNKTGILIKDFSENPHLAFSFAIVCAANGMSADLKGLESLTKEKGTSVVSLFQKEIYRFNINTDFCDYSKLKIYNNKVMQPKLKPVNAGANDFVNISFIPLAVFFGKIEVELPGDFEEKNKDLISWLEGLSLKIKRL